MALGDGLSTERYGDYERGSRAEQEEIGHQVIENAKRNGVFIDRSTHKDFGERVKGITQGKAMYLDKKKNSRPHKPTAKESR